MLLLDTGLTCSRHLQCWKVDSWVTSAKTDHHAVVVSQNCSLAALGDPANTAAIDAVDRWLAGVGSIQLGWSGIPERDGLSHRAEALHGTVVIPSESDWMVDSIVWSAIRS